MMNFLEGFDHLLKAHTLAIVVPVRIKEDFFVCFSSVICQLAVSGNFFHRQIRKLHKLSIMTLKLRR